MEHLQEAYNNWLNRYNALLEWARSNQYHPKREKAISLMAVLVGRLFNIVEVAKELTMPKVPNYSEGTNPGGIPMTYDQGPEYVTINKSVQFVVDPRSRYIDSNGNLKKDEALERAIDNLQIAIRRHKRVEHLYLPNKPNSPK